jgi:predicted RNA-binding protein with RPS1 domain
MRQLKTEEGTVFVAMPFRTKNEFDFDDFYAKILKPTIEECGLTATRGDSVFESSELLINLWRLIQKAEIVLVDFTTRSPNVALEFGWALLLGKRIVLLVQDDEDIPSDIRGRYRYISYTAHYSDMGKMAQQLKERLETIRTESTTEMIISPMPGGGAESIPAIVESVSDEYVVVKTETGRRGVLANTDVEFSRVIKVMGRRFAVGDRLDGAFEGGRYTLLAGQTNPWPLLAAEYQPGKVITSTVASVRAGVGAFVHVDHGVNGLIPKEQLDGRPLTQGSSVEVRVVRLDANQRRISLALERVIGTAGPEPQRPPVALVSRAAGPERERPTVVLPAVGERCFGTTVKLVPEADGKGGYMLLTLEGHGTRALLHVTQMTEGLRQDLNRGYVRLGDTIHVEVIKVDPHQGKVRLKEIPESDPSVGVEEARPAA